MRNVRAESSDTIKNGKREKNLFPVFLLVSFEMGNRNGEIGS